VSVYKRLAGFGKRKGLLASTVGWLAQQTQKPPDEAQHATSEKKNGSGLDRGFEPDVNRTRNLLIWSQTRYHCATDPAVVAGAKEAMYPKLTNLIINQPY
jgi:hypothetical protein